MSRTPLLAALLLAAALPARAQNDQGPVLVDAGAVRADVDQLRDAVASPANDDAGVRGRASAFFDGVPGRTPYFRPAPRVMDRENVDGRVGTIDGMLDEAQKRWDHYKFTTAEVPDARLDAAVAYAKDLRGQHRVMFDPQLPENQMGEFRYSKDKADDGVVKLNARLALLATRIGEAFAYATVVHEAAHAKARQEGRLKPETTIDNEVEAYRVQYQWLKVIDPRAERMIVLQSTLKLHLQLHPQDKVSLLSKSYVEHLLQLWDTKGEEAALKEMIKKLGYSNEGGVTPGATPIRA
ncbi:MAG TPA: hypothetical protein VN915_07575 [Elusimicrobiota bacterium]|nr:hypothetical protein [Elusimicrobiota bacterium]